MTRKKRDPAQVKAEKKHREERVQMQVRFTREEAAEIDAARGPVSRPKWMKAQLLNAAKCSHAGLSA